MNQGEVNKFKNKMKQIENRAKKNGIAKVSAGFYIIWDGDQIWNVSYNDEINGSAKWMAYGTKDSYTYLDPKYSLWEIKEALLGWKNGYRPKS
jgi:hypothetical protein